MGGKKRKLSTEVSADETATAESSAELRASLAALPRSSLLCFRRDLALHPFDEALRRFSETSTLSEPSTATAAALISEEGGQVSAKALGNTLGGDLRCWPFEPHAEAIDAAQRSLATLLEDGRQALLAALRQGDAFCSAVKKHMGRADGKALMALGKPRSMWLLGAGPEEGVADGGGGREGKRKRRRKTGTGGDEIEEDSSDEADGQEQGTDPPVSTSPEMNERPKEARSSGGSETGSNAPTVAATSAQRARKGATRRNSKANPSRGGAHGDSQDEESSGEGDKSATTAFLRALRAKRKSETPSNRKT
ncbi:unnamed protein product [Polarella glacialis]|uniref:Uncharacterized protein n=1 Tax=Polarella glacialis TaxID=89957 RepID=A0A813EH73_POLGL|nr:unnamed protein product [Polarella glacialis]